MSALQMGSSFHLKAHCQSAPLLLQFLLSAFIEVFDQFRSIEQLIIEEQFTPALFIKLAAFTGSSTERTKTFQWNPDHGTGSKLHFYAIYFVEQMQTHRHALSLLEKSCRLVRTLGLYLLEIVEQQKTSDISPVLKKLRRSIGQTAKELVKAITLLKDSENLLYFILRHKSQLDAAYGSEFTIKLFEKIFPNGLDEVKSILIEKYSNRGFEKITETIQHHFNNILCLV